MLNNQPKHEKLDPFKTGSSHAKTVTVGPVECHRELFLLKPPLARPIKGPRSCYQQNRVNSQFTTARCIGGS